MGDSSHSWSRLIVVHEVTLRKCIRLHSLMGVKSFEFAAERLVWMRVLEALALHWAD